MCALEHLSIDIDALSRGLDELLNAKAEENPVKASRGRLILAKTDEPYKHWDFYELLEPLLRQSEHEALAPNHNYVGSEHLLLAVIKLASPELVQVLMTCDVIYDRVKSSIVEILG